MSCSHRRLLPPLLLLLLVVVLDECAWLWCKLQPLFLSRWGTERLGVGACAVIIKKNKNNISIKSALGAHFSSFHIQRAGAHRQKLNMCYSPVTQRAAGGRVILICQGIEHDPDKHFFWFFLLVLFDQKWAVYWKLLKIRWLQITTGSRGSLFQMGCDRFLLTKVIDKGFYC